MAGLVANEGVRNTEACVCNAIVGSDYGTPATGNTHKFTGHTQDGATGQYYAKARYFTTQLGRWSQPEPLLKGVQGGKFLRNPQLLNPYVYCSNNPLKYVDPDGLFQTKAFITASFEASLGLFGACHGLYITGASFAATKPTAGLSLPLAAVGTVEHIAGVYAIGEGIMNMTLAANDQPTKVISWEVMKVFGANSKHILTKEFAKFWLAVAKIATKNPTGAMEMIHAVADLVHSGMRLTEATEQVLEDANNKKDETKKEDKNDENK